MELEQQTEGGIRGIPSGNQILHGYPCNLPSCALQHIVLAGHLDIKEQASSEPKKRNGGWPKGKKRKPPKEFSAPRAPTKGYVIFLNEQRIKMKAKHPDLPFTEITKMLAAQWSQLSQAGKQKYIKEAEKDKQRYMKELKAYQDSEAYQAFLERRAVHKVKTLCGSRSENEALALSTIDDSSSFSAHDGRIVHESVLHIIPCLIFKKAKPNSFTWNCGNLESAFT